MRLGSKLSPDVSELQKILIAKSLLKLSAPNGIFGPKTVGAVKLYQAAHSITPSGNVFFLTRNALNAGL
jgi:peptidoglycan hydrolase-like protein with peptidoglycan-binding domain